MTLGDSSKLARPVWHPMVHQAFHEELRVYGVRADDYRDALDYLTDLRDSRLSVYEVFGDVDFLIRGYLNEEGRTHVESNLIPRLGRMDGAFVLTGATGGSVLFTHGTPVRPINPDLVRQHPHLDFKQADEAWGTLPERRRNALLETGVVLKEEQDPSEGESIRVFCFISHSLRINRVHELGTRLCGLPALQPYIWELVVGGVTAGFIGDVLLELAVPTECYEDIIEIIRSIHHELSLAQPRTQTYVAANITHEFIDRCAFFETFDDVAARLRVEFPLLREAPTSRQGALVSLFEQLDPFLADETTRPLARSLAEARILNEASELRNAVSHLGSELESEIKERLETASQNEWGEDWPTIVTTELSMKKPYKEGWTLGEVLDASTRWNARMLPPFLSDGEIRKLMAFSALRNAAIHQQSRQKRQFEDYDAAEIVTLALQVLELLGSRLTRQD